VPASDITQRILDLPVVVEPADQAVIMAIDLSGSAERIWAHLTDPDLLATWSPIVPERPLTEVGPVLARESPDSDPFTADVLATAGDHALSHRFGDDTLEWLIDQGRLTLLLRLTDPSTAPLQLAGWQVCLGVLDARLEGHEQERIVGQDALAHGWAQLRARYARELDLPDPSADQG